MGGTLRDEQAVNDVRSVLPVVIDRCGPEELAELRVFQARFHGLDSHFVSDERQSWLFVNNPARPPDGLPIWLARVDGDIVGTDSSISFFLKVGDETLRGQWGIDLAVEREHRGRGIAGALNSALRSDCRMSFALGASEAGMRHSIRQGYTPVAPLPVRLFIVDARYLMRDGTASALARGLCRMWGPLWARSTRYVARRRRRGYTLDAIDAFDQRSDDIWRVASPSYPVIGQRDLVALRWRFDDSPERDTFHRYYLERDGNAIGYLVTRHTTWRGSPALTIVDYLAPPGFLTPIYASAIGLAEKAGAAAVIATTLNPHALAALRSLGFLQLRRASKSKHLTAHGSADDSARNLVLNPENWFLTPADCDVDHHRTDSTLGENPGHF